MKNGMKERALKGRELIVVMMEHSRVYEEWTKTAEQHQILVTNEHRARRQALMDAKAVIDYILYGDIMNLEEWRLSAEEDITAMKREIETAGK